MSSNLPKGFRTAIRRGQKPRWTWDEADEVTLGDELVLARDPLSGQPTLKVEVTGLDRKKKEVHYRIVDTRPNLLKATLPSRPGKFDANPTQDRDAARASAYTDTPKRAMRGGYTRVGNEDVYIGPEPEAVPEEYLAEINRRSKEAWEALKQRETVRRQTKATITRLRRIVDAADQQGKGLETLRKMQAFLNELEGTVSPGS